MQKTTIQATTAAAKPARTPKKKNASNTKKICLKELSSRITEMMKEHAGEMTVNDLTERFLKENTTSPTGERPWCFRTTQKRIYDVVNTFQSLGIIVKNKTKLSFVPNVGHYKQDLRIRKEMAKSRIADKQAYLWKLAGMRLQQQNDQKNKRGPSAASKDLLSLGNLGAEPGLHSALPYGGHAASQLGQMGGIPITSAGSMQRGRPYDYAFADQVKAEAAIRKSRQRLDSEQFLTTATNFTEAGQMTPGRNDLATGDNLDDLFHDHSLHYQPELVTPNDNAMINGFFQSSAGPSANGGYLDALHEPAHLGGGAAAYDGWNYTGPATTHVPQMFNSHPSQMNTQAQLMNPINPHFRTAQSTSAAAVEKAGMGLQHHQQPQSNVFFPSMTTRLPSIEHGWDHPHDVLLNGHPGYTSFE